MGTNGRDKLGRFLPGNEGGPGRPPIERERRYIETLSAVCSTDDWRQICQRAVADAKMGNYRAREWLSRYLLPEPATVTKVLHAHVPADVDTNPYINAPMDLILEAKTALFRLKEASKIEEQPFDG